VAYSEQEQDYGWLANVLALTGGRRTGAERPRHPPTNIGARPRLGKRRPGRPSVCKHASESKRASQTHDSWLATLAAASDRPTSP